MNYSKELKESILRQMMPPNNKSVLELSKENDIPEQTLHVWKRKARASGRAIPAGETSSDRWSTKDKFLIVVETAAMNNIELAEYCRAKGLYAEQVESWRDACMQANGGIAEEASRLNKTLKEKDKALKVLNTELRRKDAALAETAALLVLRKKAQAIWGDPEEE